QRNAARFSGDRTHAAFSVMHGIGRIPPDFDRRPEESNRLRHVSEGGNNVIWRFRLDRQFNRHRLTQRHKTDLRSRARWRFQVVNGDLEDFDRFEWQRHFDFAKSYGRVRRARAELAHDFHEIKRGTTRYGGWIPNHSRRQFNLDIPD